MAVQNKASIRLIRNKAFAKENFRLEVGKLEIPTRDDKWMSKEQKPLFLSVWQNYRSKACWVDLVNEKVFKVLHLNRFSGHLQGQCPWWSWFILSVEKGEFCFLFSTGKSMLCVMYCRQLSWWFASLTVKAISMKQFPTMLYKWAILAYKVHMKILTR